MSDPRTEYSPIAGRKPLKLPNGARVGVWVIVNVENWDVNGTMPRTILPTPQGATVIPDIPNYAWHEYGMRVGFWRVKDVLDAHSVRGTVSLNGSVCIDYPQIVEALVQARWEIMGHGFVQRPLPLEDDERDVIRRTIDTIKKHTGSAPRGWMGPGLAETFDTPDILAEHGIEYVCDWVADDQPYPLKVKTGRLISIPYTVEISDITLWAVQSHRASELLERGKEQFDTLYREGRRVGAIHGHRAASVPHRRPVPNRLPRQAAGVHKVPRRRNDDDRGRDPGLVRCRHSGVVAESARSEERSTAHLRNEHGARIDKGMTRRLQ